MHISFDLDDTLICSDPTVPCEPNQVPAFLRPWFREPLRLGAKALIDELVRRGCTVSVYTTSFRSPGGVKWWLRLYGIRVHRVINQAVHDEYVQRTGFKGCPSKFIPAFGIDLHVDDSEGVRMEGEKHGFSVVVVRRADRDWTHRVLEAVERRLEHGAG
jgi:hypothetical protein